MKTSGMKVLFSMAAVLVILVQLLPASDAAIKCSDLLRDLTPCVSYLTNGGTPSAACCSGVSKLASSATTPADRKAACNCILSVAQGTNPNVAATKALPGKCGISLPFTITPNMDCSKIS